MKIMDGRISRFESLNKPLRGEGGFALLLSLLVVTLLVVLILEIDFQTRADLRAAGNFQDDLKAFYLARSAVTAGEALLKEDRNGTDDLTEIWAYPFPEYPLGDGTLTAAIVDEAGKMNLNSLVDPGSGKKVEVRYKQLQRLFQLLQIDPNLADPIADWIDKDSDPLTYGAEEETYQQLDPPYSCKNRPLDTLEELHMVKGITDEIYRKIAPHLTVYGDGTVNVNTADSSVLQSLDEGIDETTARRIIDIRPFDNISKFRNGLPPEVNAHMTSANNNSPVDIKSSFFSMVTEGKVHEIKKVVHAVVKRGNKMELLYFKVE